MSRKAPQIMCSEQERRLLERLAASRTEPKQMVDRARIVLCCLAGKQVQDVAKECHTRAGTVIKWRNRFSAARLAGLADAPRPGAGKKYGADFRNKVLSTLEKPPPAGHVTWDGASVAEAVQGSKYAVWRILRKEGISLQRHRSWCVSTDNEFAAKAADIVGLYLDPPNNALVICVDERPGALAPERATGYLHTSSGKIVRGLKNTYRRHGNLNLLAALQVATGHVHSNATGLKRREEFLQFMDQVVSETDSDQELHVILDNGCPHKKCEAWLAEHPNVHLYYTSTSASWLNLVEVWFGIMSRKTLRGASRVGSIEVLRQAIEDFMAAYNPGAKPFQWRKRQAKEVQLHGAVVDLCN